MAVKRGTRPAANRTQMAVLIAAAVIGVLTLAMLSSGAAGNASDAPNAPIAVKSVPQGQMEPAGMPTVEATPTEVPTPTPRPTIARPPGPYVGIVAGHWGNDSGAVCPDGVTEQQVNLEIAKRVTERLRSRGVWVDLLQEFDDRLNGFQGDALVSIHADSCDPIDAEPPATGFKVAPSQASQIPDITNKLAECLRNEYEKATGMRFHENSITPDMTSYHSFRELDPNTPAAIIETGFLRLDYDMIVRQPDRPAEGIANGILCFLKTQ